jgi:hypothetical protein
MTAIEQRLRRASDDLDTAFADTDAPSFTRVVEARRPRRSVLQPGRVAAGLAFAAGALILILVIPRNGNSDTSLRTSGPPATTIATGTLRITQFRTASDYRGGSVGYLSIWGPSGPVLTLRSYRTLEDRQVLYSESLPIGRYEVTTYQEECRSTCDQTGAPTDQCSASFDVVPQQTVAVVIRTAPTKGCTLEIDATVTSKLPDEVALAGAITDCGRDLLPDVALTPHPARDCFLAAYDAQRAAQFTSFNRGPDTGDGNDQRIVRVDIAHKITVYRRILGSAQGESPWTKQTCDTLTPDKDAGFVLSGCTPPMPLT